MKKRVLLVGGGVISCHYAEGLKNSPVLEVAAFCDLREDCPARSAFADIPFYTDYQQAAEVVKPDIALLALTPEARMPVALYCLQNKIEVYMEKPMHTSKEGIQTYQKAAEEYGQRVTTLYHWQFADEVLFLKEYLQGKRIKSIGVHIQDDYACTQDNLVRADRLALGGAWRDSGINALSYVQEILPLQEVTLVELEERATGDENTTYFARHKFLVGGTSVEIVVDWRTQSREKQSVIETDEERLVVHHNSQRVWSGERLIFEKKVADRLTAHYANLFSSPLIEEKGDGEKSARLHQILFCKQKGKI